MSTQPDPWRFDFDGADADRAAQEQRRVEHRPITLPELRSAARHLSAQNFTPRDIAAALAISEAAVLALLEGAPP